VAIGSLAQEVGLFSLGSFLVTTVCLALLLSADFNAASLATIALSAVAMAAYIEDGLAPATLT